MIATRDSTVLVVITKEGRMGRSAEIARVTPGETRRSGEPSTRPNTTKINTGTATVPMTPSGSRTKILISSQVSFQSPRSMVSAPSVPNHVTGQLEKDVLECRELGAEVDHPHPMFRQTLDHLGHEIAPESANGQLQPLAAHRLDLRDRPKTLCGGRTLAHHDHGPFG